MLVVVIITRNSLYFPLQYAEFSNIVSYGKSIAEMLQVYRMVSKTRIFVPWVP